jgi:hypothetical protein
VTCCDTAAACLSVCLSVCACLHASPSVRTLAPFESRLSPARSKIIQARGRGNQTKPHNLERWEGEGWWVVLLLLLMATWMGCRSTPLGHPRHAGPLSALSLSSLPLSIALAKVGNKPLSHASAPLLLLTAGSGWCCWGALLLLLVVLVDNAATRLARRRGGVVSGLDVSSLKECAASISRPAHTNKPRHLTTPARGSCAGAGGRVAPRHATERMESRAVIKHTPGEPQRPSTHRCPEPHALACSPYVKQRL